MVYFDNLTATVFDANAQMPEIPSDPVPEDPDVESVVYTPSPDSFRFSVFSQTKSPKNPLEKVLSLRMADKINNYIDFSMLMGSGCDGLKSYIDKPQLHSAEGGYKSINTLDAKFFKLDTGSGGLRTSPGDQWSWLISQLNGFTGKQAFFIMETHPDDFSDKKEGELFKKILSEYVQQKGLTMWVFYPGKENRSCMDGGVKYIEVSGFEHQDVTPESLDSATYALVTVRGDKVTYEFKPIL